MLMIPLLRKGEKRDVPEWTWATLARPAANKNVEREAGDTFGLTKGGSVEVIGKDDRYGVLVRYSPPRADREPAGTRCPDGALIWMEARELASWPPEGAVLKGMAEDARERMAAVDRLLRQ